MNREATKRNILTAFSTLAGNKNERQSNENALPTSFAKLQTAQPEDAIAFLFSGHGKSKDGHSYILPYDLGIDNSAQSTKMKSILSHSISDLELEKAFRQIDAGQIILVLDACQSGDALRLEDERQGQFNTKGLGQLAYDKGMYIIAASQGSQNAYISDQLQRSYLSYALIEQGLKTADADTAPKDGKLSIREWFDFAASRVSLLRREGIERQLKIDQGKDLEEEIPNGENTDITQRPRAFYRRQIDLSPLIISSVK